MSTESNPILMTINSNTCVDLECSICYKPITKTFFQCSAPCNKIIHVSCMEQMMEQAEEAAWQEDKEVEHKCCYCRREINIEKYCLQLVARRLVTLHKGGYEVKDAMKMIKKQMLDEELEEDIEYNIYELHDTHFIKKPKQSKRVDYKKAQQKPKRITIKQNIGGRRR